MRKYFFISIIIFACTLAQPLFAATPNKASNAKQQFGPFVGFFASMNEFRQSTYAYLVLDQKETTKRLDALNKGAAVGKKPLDATEKPIAYIKLFLLIAAAFIMSSVWTFYGILALILILIARIIYRKVRRRR